MLSQAEGKRVRALQQKKYRAETQRFLVQGRKVVAELLALSGRRRQALEDALARIRYLHPGDDVSRAEGLLRAALRRGDAS